MNRLSLKISCFVVSVVIWMQVASTAEVAGAEAIVTFDRQMHRHGLPVLEP